MELMDSRGFTPLLIAAKRGNEEATKLLIESGSSVLHNDAEGNSLLHRLVMKNRWQCTKSVLHSLDKVG